MSRPTGWSEEREQALRRMWGEGESASAIAKELGGLSRNAVIGKIHRLGLGNRTGEAGKPKPSAKKKQPSSAKPQSAANSVKVESTLPGAEISKPQADPNVENGWPENVTNALRYLHGKNLPFSRIARELNALYPNRKPTFKIAALSQKANSLGLPRRENKFLNGRRKKHPTAPVEGGLVSDRDAHISAEAQALEEKIKKIPRQRKGILDLTERTCKWPIGDPSDPDFFFCGEPADGTRETGKRSPYCEAHTRLAFQPVAQYRPKNRRV